MAAVIPPTPANGPQPASMWTATGPYGAPRYELVKCPIIDLQSHYAVMVTDEGMQDHRQASAKGRGEWFAASGGPQGLMGTYNKHYTSGLMGGPPAPGRTRITSGPAGAASHNVNVMVNMPDFDPTAAVGAHGSVEHFRQVIYRIMSRTVDQNLPLVVHPPMVVWRRKGNHVALELIGSGVLGYTAEVAAEHMLASITGWFHHPANGAMRRAQIQTVYFCIPSKDSLAPLVIERAFKRAWARYIVTPPGYPPRLRLTEAEGTRQAANIANAGTFGLQIAAPAGLPLAAPLIITNTAAGILYGTRLMPGAVLPAAVAGPAPAVPAPVVPVPVGGAGPAVPPVVANSKVLHNRIVVIP